MARPIKIGLDYFPLDTNIDSDDKIQLIEAEFGNKGFAIVIKLFCKIYADKGYYYNWTDKEKLLFAKKMGESIGLVDEIVKRSVKWGLFNESVFNQFQILSSEAIQRRFLEAVSRRETIEIIQEYLLININAYKNKVNVNIYSINVDNSTQSKVKEIKVKEKDNEEDLSTTQILYDEAKVKAEKCLKDKIWIEQVQMLTKFPKNEGLFAKVMDDFCVHSSTTEISHKDSKDFKQHFKSWLLKNGSKVWEKYRKKNNSQQFNAWS